MLMKLNCVGCFWGMRSEEDVGDSKVSDEIKKIMKIDLWSWLETVKEICFDSAELGVLVCRRCYGLAEA